MFNTDKVRLGYLPTYLKIAGEIGTAGRVCEVGVHAGGSLEMWLSLFPDGLVIGVDHDNNATWPQDAARIVIEQNSPELPVLVSHYSAHLDLVIDDASHDGNLTGETFGLLWPLVASGSYYVIEDWMVGFRGWSQHDDSMLALARALIDRLEERDGDVDSITYRYGQIILRRK